MNLANVMITVLGLAAAVVYLAIIAALVHKYRRTGDRGFLWLGVPLVIGPLLGVPLDHWLHLAMDRLASGGRVGYFPFTLVERGTMTLGDLISVLTLLRHLIWSGLILVAILMLHKTKAGESASRVPSPSRPT
jgi:hypothetical protein